MQLVVTYHNEGLLSDYHNVDAAASLAAGPPRQRQQQQQQEGQQQQEEQQQPEQLGGQPRPAGARGRVVLDGRKGASLADIEEGDDQLQDLD
jgi:hypothetical protein